MFSSFQSRTGSRAGLVIIESEKEPRLMKVCHIVSTFPRRDDDPEVPWLLESIRRLKKEGIEVTILAPSYQGLGDQEIHGLRVKRFRYFFRKYENLTHDEGAPNKMKENRWYWGLLPFYLFFGAIAAIRLSRRERFDIFHVHWPLPHGIFAYFASRTQQSKIILHFYGAELALARKQRLLRVILRWIVNQAERVIVISSFTANELKAITGREADVIPFGFAIEGACIQQTGGESGVKEILFVGRLIRRKGVQYLVEALSLIRREVDARLIIVGEGFLKGELKRLAQEMRLGDFVSFPGKVSQEELEGHYRNCDVFVLPAIHDASGDTEGLGVVLLEALGFKKPVVASRVGGIADIIEDGKTGLLVPEKDAQALAHAIVRILRDEKLSRALGQRGYKRVGDVFSWEKIVAGLIQIYSETAS